MARTPSDGSRRDSQASSRRGIRWGAFDAPVGAIGLAWSDVGLLRVMLPSPVRDRRDPRGMLAMMDALAIAEPEGRASPLLEVGADAARAIDEHLRGRDAGLGALRLDTHRTSPFALAVYRAAQEIPAGEVRTYADVARSVGTVSFRAVGTALGRNPWPIVVPCHRVVGASGVGGFSSPGGLSQKAELMAIEGGALDDEEHSVARRHLARVDPALRPWLLRHPCALPLRPRPIESGGLERAIVRAIVGQQLSTRAAATVFARVEQAMEAIAPLEGAGAPGDPRWLAAGISPVWAARPIERLGRLDDASLRALGLSAAKLAAIRDLSARLADGRLSMRALVRAPDAEVIAQLSAVRGIGRWTAEMLLIFELGRPDVMPVDDLGIRKAVLQLEGRRALPDEGRVLARTEAYRPFRSIGAYYLWRTLDP